MDLLLYGEIDQS